MLDLLDDECGVRLAILDIVLFFCLSNNSTFYILTSLSHVRLTPRQARNGYLTPRILCKGSGMCPIKLFLYDINI